MQNPFIICDNFYTSVQLFKDLFANWVGVVGTVKTKRKGFPNVLRNIKVCGKKLREEVWWHRVEEVLTVQWWDKKKNPVNVMSIDRMPIMHL